MDHGGLPAAITAISKDLGIIEVQMGGLGSLVFFGLVIGSATATFVLSVFQYKNILILSLLLNGSGLFLFTLRREYYLMGLARFISGFSQIFLSIYAPLFVDTFCTSKQKSIWLSFILLAPPLGVVFGYGYTSILIAFGYSWQLTFNCLALAMIICAVIMSFVPKTLLNLDEIH